MPLISDSAKDAALNVIRSGTALHLCSAEPATLAAVGTLSLGSVAVPVMDAPADRVPNGRKVTIPVTTTGTIDTAGTATHWALVSATELLASGPLASSRTYALGDGFSSADPIDIGIPDAVVEP